MRSLQSNTVKLLPCVNSFWGKGRNEVFKDIYLIHKASMHHFLKNKEQLLKVALRNETAAALPCNGYGFIDCLRVRLNTHYIHPLRQFTNINPDQI